MSKLAVQTTNEIHIKVLTKNIIAGMQCCCADAVDLLDQAEADTDDLVSELCDVNSELDSLKVKLRDQLTKDDVTSNILKPLFIHLQAFAEIMKNIATSYGLKQACILQVIMKKLSDSYDKIVSKFYKDDCYKPIHQLLNTQLKELDQQIAKLSDNNTSSWSELGKNLGFGLLSVSVILYLICTDTKNTPVASVGCALFGTTLIGPDITQYIGHWIGSLDTENIKKQGKKKAEEKILKQKC